MKKIRNAVSVIFECNGEVFSIERQNHLKNYPGYTAFVGGKVDKEDYEKKFDSELLAKHVPELIAALIRETKEEIGIDVLKLIDDKIITDVKYIGRALTPDFNIHRFNTSFFKVSFVKKMDFTLDHNEIKNASWSTPIKVLDQWKQGERLIVPPVRYFIEALAKDINFKDILIFENRFDLDKVVPWVESISGLIQVMPLSNTIPPAQRTNAFIVGDIIIDPSPKDEDEYNKFCYTIKNYNLSSIFITHHHKDHHQFSTKLAKDYSLPMSMSAYTYHRCKNVYGEHYFSGIKINFVGENEIVTKWKNEDVIVIEVPGHDDGQLALIPASKKWMIVSDLFQGIGTVVVGGEEGDMQKYFSTLKKVIELKPDCVIPSHGIALGGTFILEKTLEHREFREKQILQMHNEGLDKEQMLKRIYFDIPIHIHKYALANIESHLEKLKNEDKL
jgi:ribonuclease/clavin/mitogillin